MMRQLHLLDEVWQNTPHDVGQLDYAIGSDASIPSGASPAVLDRLSKLNGGSSKFTELGGSRALKLHFDVTIESLLCVADRGFGFSVLEVPTRVVYRRAQAFENDDAVIADVAEILLCSGLAEVSAQFGEFFIDSGPPRCSSGRDWTAER
jgi:hypothetical protein